MLAYIVLGVLVSYWMEVGLPENKTSISTPDQVAVVDDEVLLHVVNEHYPYDETYVPELAPFGGVQVSRLACDDLDDILSIGDAVFVQDPQHGGNISGHGIHQGAVKIEQIGLHGVLLYFFAVSRLLPKTKNR